MKNLTKLSIVLSLVLLNLSFAFSQTKTDEVMKLGGRMNVHTYPNAYIDDVLVQGEGKKITFPLANYSANPIVRACKLFIIENLNVKTLVWSEVVTIPAWDFINIDISGCDNLLTIAPGDYHLLLVCEHSSDLNSVTYLSPMVPVVDGGSGAQNPHPIEIDGYGTYASGCTNYYINFDSPNSSTTWTTGQTYEITWHGNADLQISSLELTLHQGTMSAYSINPTTNNDGSYFYTVPDNIPPNTNYYIQMYNNDGPYINTRSQTFTIQNPPGNSHVELTNISVPGDFQKGEPVTLNATFTNTGNADFNGNLFLSWHNASMGYITDLATNTSGLSPGASVTLSFSSSAIQSDVGNYFVVAKYYDPDDGQYHNLSEQNVHVLGMTVDGLDLSDAHGDPNHVYDFSDIVSPASIESVALRSFIVIKNTNSGETTIEEMNNSKTQYAFNLSRNFDGGNYDVQYVSFYDWDATKNNIKTEIKTIGSLPWYCFWGLHSVLTINEPTFTFNDMTNYSSQEEPIANYNNFVFSLRINKDATVNTNDMVVQMRFYNVNTGVIDIENMYYVEAVDLWFLEKTFDDVSHYDYRFLLNYNQSEYSYPNSNNSPLSIEVFPYFDVSPMNQEGVVHTSQFLFYTYVYPDNSSDSHIYLRMRKPDYYQEVVELSNDGNHHFYWTHTFDQAGYYQYYFEAISPEGQHFYSDTSQLFVGFGDDCSTIGLPGIVDRSVWCPGCSSNNPGNGMPTHIIIHDTEFSNIYDLRQHDMNNGSPDIRYHYLINNDGLIFEGVEGGPNKRAEHFNCMNGHTISIGFLDAFDTHSPNTYELKSFDLLLEYLCSEYQIDPYGVSDQVFYDFDTDNWEVNEAMPQVSLHSIVGSYPDYACNLSSVGNCPGIMFPDLETTLLNSVHYCPDNSQHTSIELGADITVNVSESNKSLDKDVLIESKIITLGDSVMVNCRALLATDTDSLLVQKIDDILISPFEENIIAFEGIVGLDTSVYKAIIQYQINDSSNWISLSSELYENEITVDMTSLSLVSLDIQKDFILFPNPCNGSFDISFSSFDDERFLEIYDISGKKVLSQKLEEHTHINSSLYRGIYFVKIYEYNRIFVEKLIID